MGQPPSGLGPAVVVPADRGDAPSPSPPADEPESWWARYRRALELKLSRQALAVLEADARYVVERAVPSLNGAIDPEAWPADGVRTGMVVGSVQSGKTSSMLAVAALALDSGVDLLILLAGTRVSLWLQTYERLLAQLDGSTAEDAYRRRSARLILPQPDDVLNENRADPGRYLQRPLARQALKSGRPIICVIPKEDDHLRMLRRYLVDVITEPYLAAREQPYTILLLDDEADDASVLDSASSQKVTPRLITALWSGDEDIASVRNPNIRATYVAYTATPQANYLQATHNPLSPRHFNAALRTPGAGGSVEVRSLTFAEPSGVANYYCGGEMFYELLRSVPSASLCEGTPFPELLPGDAPSELAARHEQVRWAMLSDALRSFMVGAAVRLHQEPARRYNRQVLHAHAQAAADAAPLPHTMLMHPSARKDDHFAAAADIVRWSMSLAGHEAETVIPGEELGEPELKLSPDGLTHRLLAEEGEWVAWLGKFEASRIALSTLPNAGYPSVSVSDWPEVRRLLIEQVFPNLTLRVLNSDPASDDRPRFEPERLSEGFRAPPDVLSIFVAGNVLSRGLTLEGLATSLFLRGASEPAADTQMQMQRWFGYRGPLLPFCRIFAFEDQVRLFERYHVNDNALKSEIISKMGEGDGASAAALVLQGASFLATSKVESRKVPLSPGARPSIRLVEAHDPDVARANVDLVEEMLSDGSWVALKDDKGLERGCIRDEPLGLLALAALLERLRYSHHDPELSNELSERWAHYGSLLRLEGPLFRPPGINPQPYACEPQSCPYSIAAYLRLWDALRGDRHAPGFYPTDRPDVPWSFADTAYSKAPRFYVAIRHGDKKPKDPRLQAHSVRAMTRQLAPGGKMVQTLWGTRGYGGTYFGDELVDYYHHRSSPIPSIQGTASWRPRGHPGLALIHVITNPSGGEDLVGFGLGLPHGGPDHIAALRA